MITIIAIIGEAGSGKDFLTKRLVKKHPALFHEIVSCTTRPKRGGEKDGIDYYFLTQEQFLEYEIQNKMLESTNFRGWYYGTLLDSLSETKINIGVFNPEGIRNLQKRDDIFVIVYRLAATPKVRLLRQLNREEDPDVDEIIRRYSTDKDDFEKIDFNYVFLFNNDGEELAESEQELLTRAMELWDGKG